MKKYLALFADVTSLFAVTGCTKVTTSETSAETVIAASEETGVSSDEFSADMH